LTRAMAALARTMPAIRDDARDPIRLCDGGRAAPQR